jgi:sulfite reductase (ferredoxin)
MEKILAGLEISGLDLDGLKDLNINISGCPNSCGQQSAADLGFYGKVGRTDRIFPAYTIMAGARKGEEISRLARTVDEISARDLPRVFTGVPGDIPGRKVGIQFLCRLH